MDDICLHQSMVDGFCGAPEGGKALATALSLTTEKQYIFPEKKVTALATAGSREESELVFSRHEPIKDERWVIVEDVCNNFSTTATLVERIEKYGAHCVGIVCFLNRSAQFHGEFTSYHDQADGPTRIPIVSLVQKPLPQYRQDDSAVAEDVKAGNVVWKPKNEWDKLAAAMEAAK
jgi:orotate phosphoribosyltransferase